LLWICFDIYYFPPSLSHCPEFVLIFIIFHQVSHIALNLFWYLIFSTKSLTLPWICFGIYYETSEVVRSDNLNFMTMSALWNLIIFM
jgi:hypothetical protein